jgi:hypothetical protein
LGNVLPPTLPGGDIKGNIVSDDATLASAEAAPKDGEQGQITVVFSADKNASTTSPRAGVASPRAGDSAPGLSRAQSVQVKAGAGPIMPDRELNVNLSIWQDSGNNYLTVQATNAVQGINYEGKVQIADNYWTSVTVKEFKRKLNGFPPTSDRGVLTLATGNKNLKDTDKLAALGVKGKRGDTLKYQLAFELASTGGSDASSAPAAAVITGLGEAAPELDPKHEFNVEMSTSFLEGNVFLKLTCTSSVLPEIHKSAALPKVTFQVFNVKDLHGLLKGPTYPVLQSGWAIFDSGNGKIKVGDATALAKLGVVAVPSKTSVFKFIFAIDPNAALPSV